MQINVEKARKVSLILIIIGIIGVVLGILFTTESFMINWNFVGMYLSAPFVISGCLSIISGLVLYCLE